MLRTAFGAALIALAPSVAVGCFDDVAESYHPAGKICVVDPVEPGGSIRIQYENGLGGMGRYDFARETAAGPVLLRLMVRQNLAPTDDDRADTLTVLEAPPGYMAVPAEVTVHEGQTAEVLLVPGMS